MVHTQQFLQIKVTSDGTGIFAEFQRCVLTDLPIFLMENYIIVKEESMLSVQEQSQDFRTV